MSWTWVQVQKLNSIWEYPQSEFSLPDYFFFHCALFISFACTTALNVIFFFILELSFKRKVGWLLKSNTDSSEMWSGSIWKVCLCPGYGYERETSPGLYKIKSQQPQVLCDMIAGGRGWEKKSFENEFLHNSYRCRDEWGLVLKYFKYFSVHNILNNLVCMTWAKAYLRETLPPNYSFQHKIYPFIKCAFNVFYPCFFTYKIPPCVDTQKPRDCCWCHILGCNVSNPRSLRAVTQMKSYSIPPHSTQAVT